MLFFQNHERPGMEAFRTLRSRLLQVREKTAAKKILVAGSSGNEGKSFVAANLAQVMVQQQGSRALLIDGNLRGGQLHVELGAPVEPGLSNYLAGNTEACDIIQRGRMENFYFVASGSSTANPLELVSNGRMSMFMNTVDTAFDWIIVDSCPAGLLTDAGMLANYCDAVLLVVRYNTTPYDLAQKTRREFYGKKILGVVLNGIDSGSK
jgi:tyrosine-protein kinase Etk/Wzc